MALQNKKVLAWDNISFFTMVHILGLVGIWYACKASPGITFAAIGCFFMYHLAITVGAHRYFTHDAFKAHPSVAYVSAIIFSGNFQSTLLEWVRGHKKHHRHEDERGQDPHTPLDGFLHAHMGTWFWKSKEVKTKFKKKMHSEELRFRVMYWQARWVVPLSLLMGFGVPTFIGWLLGDWLGGLLVVGFSRLMFQYHLTWIVNSVGHTLGDRADRYATNFGNIICGPLMALLTVGEAWHANHHLAAGHWRLGRKWTQLDPGAWVIWLLYKIGLVSDLNEPEDRKLPKKLQKT